MFSSLTDFHNAVAKETIEGFEVGESKIFQEIDFMLDSPEGALSLKDLRGNVVLLFFGFTSSIILIIFILKIKMIQH